jgi:hypothetical protein
VDENAVPIELWPDADGDGFYDRKEGESVIGCVGLMGYAAFAGDCDPNDPAINPDAEEICNYRDDDCDGEADNRVRPVCGEGWCRRSSSTCEQDDCFPGEPEPETCNYLDDDCDGEIDEGALCPAGQECLSGECVSTDRLVASGGSDAGASASGGGSDSVAGGGASRSGSASSSSGCSLSGSVSGRTPWLAVALGSLALVGRRRRRASGA